MYWLRYLLGIISAGAVVELVLNMVRCCPGGNPYSSSSDATNVFNSLKVQVSIVSTTIYKIYRFSQG